MIQINLNLFATLAKYRPKNPEGYEIVEGKTVEELITDLKVPREQVKLIFINGKRKNESYQLKSGDRVGIFPPVGGG